MGVAKIDWGTAPDVSPFYGRLTEIQVLERWIVKDRCKIVMVHGLRGVGKTQLSAKLGKGGIGKSDLSVKLAKGISSKFDYVIWRSLLNEPRFGEVVLDVVYFLSDGKEYVLPDTLQGQVNLFISYLQKNRCLVVLDNIEAILQSSTDDVDFKPEFDAYKELLRQAGEVQHKSCILLNGREVPKVVEHLSRPKGSVRLLELTGLDEESCRRIIADEGLVCDDDSLNKLVDFYNGNPLAIDIVAKHIKDVYFGRVTTFLDEGRGVFKSIQELLDWHFDRLTSQEKELMLWLAVNREPVALFELKEDVVSADSKERMADTIQSFQRRLPLVKSSNRFTLQPVLMEYATSKLVKEVVSEVQTSSSTMMERCVLCKAQAKDYIRDIQSRLIIKPIVNNLQFLYSREGQIDDKLQVLLDFARQKQDKGYITSNVITLMQSLDMSLIGKDFSALTVRQAYLQNSVLHKTSFLNSNLPGCVFRSTLGTILVVSIDPNGQAVATGDNKGEIHLWGIEDGKELMTYKGHSSWVRSIAFSPTQPLLASCSSDYTVKVWDILSGECLHTLRGHSDQVYSVSFSNDGKLLASGGEDQRALIWDIDSGKVVQEIKGQSGRVRSVCFSSRGILAVADDVVSLWDYEGQKLVGTLQTEDDYIRQVIFTRDSEIVASIGDKTRITLWRLATQELVKVINHSRRVRCIDFSANGNLLASSGDDGRIQIWNWKEGKVAAEFVGHTASVKSVAISNNNDFVVSGSDDQSVKVWSVKRKQCLTTIKGYGNAIRSVSYSPVGKMFVTGGEDGIVRLWDSLLGKDTPIRTFEGHSETVQSVAFSPDGSLISSGGNEQFVKLWDVRSGKCLSTLIRHDSWVWNIAFSPNGALLAVGSRDHVISLWDVGSGKHIRDFIGHEDEVHSVCFSPDGRALASGSDDNRVHIWDVDTGRRLFSLTGHTNCVRSVTYSLSGRILATASDDLSIRFWDTTSNYSLIKKLFGHKNRVRCVVFGASDDTVFSSSDDNSIKAWSIKEESCTNTYSGHESAVWSIAYDKNRNLILSGSEDETIRLWPVINGDHRVLRPYRPYEGMNIYGVSGLTEAQVSSLSHLGAIKKPLSETAVLDQRTANSITSSEATESAAILPANDGSDRKPNLALVMKGGGVKGLAYIGALKELEKYHNFDWFIGTSAGAIAAVLLAAGYNSTEVESIFCEKNFTDFLDARPYQWPFNLLFRKGVFPANTFTAWIDKLLSKKLDVPTRVTLGQLPYRATIYACRRGKGALVFDSHDEKTNHLPAAYAVRCSMSIPFVFVPQMDAGMRVLDGGMRNNYPVDDLLRHYPDTNFIGLYLGPEYFEGQESEGWLLSDLLAIWQEATDIEALEKHLQRTVVIDPRPISTINFKLTNDEKQFLLKAGRLGALKYLRKTDLQNRLPPQHIEITESEVDEIREEVETIRKSLTRSRKVRWQKSILVLSIILILVALLIIVTYRFVNQ